VSGTPRCDYCLRPQRAAVVRVLVNDGNRSRPDSRIEVDLCRMHFGRQAAMRGVEIVDWLNEVAQRDWEADVAAGAVPEVPRA